MKINRFDSASENLRFASSVAGFGMLLRDSRYKGNANFSQIREIADSANGNDLQGYRREFAELVNSASALEGRYSRR